MILETIAEATRKRVAAEKEKCSLAEMKEKATAMNPDTGFPFEQTLKKPGMSFICEVKKASPSKGIIAEDFPYLEIAKEYEAAGASAISCLTEPEYFKGDKRYLKKIAETVSIPVLRKDFTVDPYMIYEAKVLGATAVLLICALLPEETLKEYLETAHSLGLSALVEAHDEAEVAQAMRAGARIIGVNNRNLKDFTVDIHNSERLRELVPENIVFVSESGIKTPEDVGRLYQNKTDAVLIGETLMRSSNKKAELEKLILALAAPYQQELTILQTAPGISSEFTAIGIISEIGTNMEAFPSAKHLCSWAGLTPTNNESAGKKKSVRVSKAGCYIKPLLVQCANAVVTSKKHPEMRNRYLRLRKRRGHKKAIIAIARMLLTALYHMLKNGENYNAELYQKSDLPPVDREITVEQALIITRNQGYKIKSATI